MPHTFELNNKSLKKIEKFLPRLKYAIFPNKIINWLENFDEEDVSLMLDLLLVFEYVTFDELLFRFDDLLKDLLKNVASTEKVLIVPYGKPGKSGSIITYIVKNTSAYKSRKSGSVVLSNDLKFIRGQKYKHVVFIDDFVGSGKTFCDFYKSDLEKWVVKYNIENVYLLTALIMKDGKDLIKDRIKSIKIFSEERNKIFDPIKSPLRAFKNIDSIKDIALKYGKAIKENPLGFDGSESLISFFLGTPNNTLPIIWSAKKKWISLFPRKADIRMDIARETKKDIAFMIGVFNKLAIDLYDKDKIILIDTANGRKRKINYNSKQHHSVLGLIKLKKDGYNDIFICHLLGLTMKELNVIYDLAIKLNLIHKSKSVTIEGHSFFLEVTKVTKKENFRKDSSKNLIPKENIFIPKMFDGKA